MRCGSFLMTLPGKSTKPRKGFLKRSFTVSLHNSQERRCQCRPILLKAIPGKEIGNWGGFDIALGSLAEVKYLLHFSQNLGYISDSDYKTLSDAAQHVGRKLWKFYERVREG